MVLLKQDSEQNEWSIEVIEDVMPDSNGIVKSVKVYTRKSNQENQNQILETPVYTQYYFTGQKLIPQQRNLIQDDCLICVWEKQVNNTYLLLRYSHSNFYSVLCSCVLGVHRFYTIAVYESQSV